MSIVSKTRFASSVLFALTLAVPVLAQDLPAAKQTQAGLYLAASDAGAFLENKEAVFIDVRTRSEVAFLGLPERVDLHIPYMVMPMMPEYDAERKGYALEINPDFPLVFGAYASERGMTTDTPIVLICRSGSRSARAADLLNSLGYTQVYSVIDGYEGDKAKEGPRKGQRALNGWKNAGLPWSYSIRPDQAYPEDRM